MVQQVSLLTVPLSGMSYKLVPASG